MRGMREFSAGLTPWLDAEGSLETHQPLRVGVRFDVRRARNACRRAWDHSRSARVRLSLVIGHPL